MQIRLLSNILVLCFMLVVVTKVLFPSGVGFRRAFLEFRVVDNDTGKTVWCSGCTNELGVIMNGNERLPSELFDVYKDGTKLWVAIRRMQTEVAQASCATKFL